MLIVRAAIVWLSLIHSALALEAKAFSGSGGVYLTLTNKSFSTVSVAKDLILGECDSFANICMTIRDRDGSSIEILSRPMNFDHDFKRRVDIEPRGVYGLFVDNQEIIRRFGLSEGCYQLTFTYSDRHADYVVDSNAIEIEVHLEDHSMP